MLRAVDFKDETGQQALFATAEDLYLLSDQLLVVFGSGTHPAFDFQFKK